MIADQLKIKKKQKLQMNMSFKLKGNIAVTPDKDLCSR